MIPVSSNYPAALDTDNNLYVVHDSLRMRLVDDYNPGDTSINVEGDFLTVAHWPPTGKITLTEQCSDIDLRAISFHYTNFDTTNMIISGLEILPGFTDVIKPKTITNVTVNVMAEDHNNLVNALIAIQEFCGVKGTTDTQPFGPTLEGRINFLRNLVLQPKAWFGSDVRTGNVPLEVEFKNLSFRLGTDGTSHLVRATWDFGDHTVSDISITSIIIADSVVPDSPIDVLVRDSDGGNIKKTYHQPGIYDVKLTVENDFGSDTVIFPHYINARIKAPSLAIVRYVENPSNQELFPGIPPDGPFEVVPRIRSPINTLIQIEVDEGENPATPGISFAGETLNNLLQPIDPVVDWTWALDDDLDHPNSRQTKASYSVGGLYDMKLRVDTNFGAFRITHYSESIDIVENVNLWHWIFLDSLNVRAYEFGLISETYKLSSSPSLSVTRNSSFLNGLPNAPQQIAEFNRNVGFAPRSTTVSGKNGPALLMWASGRNVSDPPSSEVIKMVEFSGFTQTYVSRPSVTRQWNWANLNSPQASYFVFGTVPVYPPSISPTNQNLQALSLNDLSVTSNTLTNANYLNAANELTENVSIFDISGQSVYGNFSVYRTTWKDSTGYILRNDGVGPFFRIKSFYRTEGTTGLPFQNIRKMQDLQGLTKVEGQLVPMSTALYFLNNSGSISAFSPSSSLWTSGGVGVNSILYRGLQDTTVVGYDNQANTLLAASDSDSRAYMSFDYSPNAFLRFNSIDLTFVSLGGRPAGNQWIMEVF